MKAYAYDIENYYNGEIELQESPLESGVYFDRPNSTRIPIPQLKENEAAFWNGSSWEIKPDFSGKIYYSKIDKSTRTFIRGEVFDNDYTDLVPPSESYITWQRSSWGEDLQKKSEYQKNLCKSRAKVLLIESDWAELPSVIEQLENAAAWKTYRTGVRSLLISPVENPSFPQKPETLWKK